MKVEDLILQLFSREWLEEEAGVWVNWFLRFSMVTILQGG
jgi:hypothetical protein